MPTIGMEIELQGLPRAATAGLDYIRHEVHDDGSVRGATYCVDGLPLMFTKHERGDGRLIVPSGCGDWQAENIGLEIVTRPYEYEELRPLAVRLSKDLGHIPQTPRTSVHIHVDVAGKSWRYVQRLIKWAYWLEAPLMRLAAGNAGLPHRGARNVAGEYNDYRYARPLSAPIGIRWGSTDRPLVDIERLLAATTASQMMSYWGRLDLYWGSGLGHYVPHRLHMVNLVAVMRLGTMEWRLFDAVYSKIPLFLDLVMAVHRLAENPALLPEELLYPKPAVLNDPATHEQVSLARLCDVLGMDLGPLWGKTWMPGTRNTIRRSHYQEMSLATFNQTPVQNIFTNAERYDDGSSEFILYTRRERPSGPRN